MGTSLPCRSGWRRWTPALGLAFLAVAAASLVGAQDSRTATKPGAVAFRRVHEPNEAAFSLLVPQGWIVEGGIYRVNPLVAGGPFNSMWPKCDLTLKSDRAGATLVRFLPSYNFADFSDPRFGIQRKLFPPGAKFQGGLVRPMPSAEQFLTQWFEEAHRGATGVKARYHSLPELAAIINTSHKAANDMLAMLGMPAVSASAGVLLTEYREGGVAFKEAILTALVDARGAAAYWCNAETILLRAPADQAARWQPAADVIVQSIRLNPAWFKREIDKLDRTSRILTEAAAQVREENYKLWQQRQKIMDRLDTDWMLYRSGQANYANPFTGTADVDSSAWQYRWVTRLGDVVYSDDPNYNPNADSSLWTNDWQKTPVTQP